MKVNRWSYWFLGFLLLTAVLADFIANDRPIVAEVDGGIQFPVLDRKVKDGDWDYRETDWAIWPPIPFKAGVTDLSEEGFRRPLSKSGLDRGRHWLGTDGMGRDIAAGVVNGTRVAVIVGVGSVLVSLLIGLPLGAVSGFFGDGGLRLSRGSIMAVLFGLLGGGLYAIGSLSALGSGWLYFTLLLVLAVTVGICFWWLLFGMLGKSVQWLASPVGVPLDRVIMLIIELTLSIPGLVLLVTLLAYVEERSLLLIVGIIGLLGWPPVARFLRAEMMRIRNLGYIAAARVSGVGEFRLLWRHALPNAIEPVIVVIAFMVGTSVLAESMLSFLGIGMPTDQVTWGGILKQSRARVAAWWLAVFPGLLLTLTVLACNSLRKDSSSSGR